MNGKASRETAGDGVCPTSIHLIVEFDKELFNHVVGERGVAGWNDFVGDLFERRLLAACWASTEMPPPLVILFDFRGLRRAHYRLDDVDLRCCWLQGADFTGASLKNSHLGCGRGVSYRKSRLHGADFRHVEISGCDFTGAAGIETAIFDGAVYDPANPPLGLPPETLAKCKPEAEPPPADHRLPTNPMEPWFRQSPLRCHATIHIAPTEE